MTLWNIGICLQNYVVSHPRRPHLCIQHCENLRSHIVRHVYCILVVALVLLPHHNFVCLSCYYQLYCHMLSNSRRSFGLAIGFIDHFTIWLVTTLNYSAIANFQSLQITTAHTKSFQSAFTSRFPITDLNNGHSSTAPTKSSLHRLLYNWLPSLQLTTF
jgi:hypothetical protein